MRRITAISAGLSIFASVALAGEPVAIVEEVSATQAAIAPMEFLESGRTINLGNGGELVLGYLRSCIREHIAGGVVTIGAEQSTVNGGRIFREPVECDGGKLVLTAEQAAKSGVLVFRKPLARD